MKTVICQNCGKVFISDKYHPYAKRCSAKCSDEYLRKTHNYQKLQRQRIKKKILTLLGNKCVKCGYNGVALQVDHINGRGKREIMKYRLKQNALVYWNHILKKIESGSKDYQLLCANHNIEKYYGVN